jgi:hypothetical protein
MRHLYIISLSILFICAGCKNFPESVYSLRVRNKSSQTISVFAGYILPDTVLPSQKPEMKTILPGEFKDIYDDEVGDDEFERFFNNEKLTLFVLSSDTITKYLWATIAEEYMILKRYELLPEDLEEYGSVSYP